MGRTGFFVALGVLAGCSSGDTGPADGSAPQVVIATPANGATVSGQVTIFVEAVDDFGVDQVRILVDGTLIATLYTPPFTKSWNTIVLPDNTVHTIRAEALDVAKNIGSFQISVTVLNGPQ